MIGMRACGIQRWQHRGGDSVEPRVILSLIAYLDMVRVEPAVNTSAFAGCLLILDTLCLHPVLELG